ncbi:MAG TPA: SDR family oxidoreductase [Propionibacteriaceae bacterium]|nr:SDR family oxidoreductase [Propionibacteriaceae bacterium]
MTTYSSGWALVTGASSGLGRGFATRLAADGMSLVLVSRSTVILHDLADELREAYGVEVEVVGADLADPVARDAVVKVIESRDIDLLVNNAGFATSGDFVDENPARITELVSLNCVALTVLARAAATRMVARGHGAIVNVASTAAFQPIPTMGTYAASKAYVLRLSLAMWDELRPKGVTVLALCPGATETEFWKVAGNPDGFRRRRTVAQVIATCFDGLAKGSPIAIDGAWNALLARMAPFVPIRLTMLVSRYIARRP